MDPEKELTPALEAAKRRRATLHDQLVHVEQAISSPAAGRVPEWASQVVKEMVGLRDAFDQHILVTEKPDGLYEEIMHRAPRLAGNVHRLQEEHPALERQIVSVLERLESGEVGETWAIDDCRDDLQRVLGGIVKHRQHGADLVWEAYNVDIGGHG
ncbi:MAG: hypothetical protein HY240_11555 [Actinobacteria bacterium]|nr:hypothetical protein [Actinomycetota bacterium]